jgi:hypothetical protein
LCRIEIDPGNEWFKVKDGFLISRKERCLIRPGETGSEVRIPDFIEVLGPDCFTGCRSVCAITFDPQSRLCAIETGAFTNCESLVSLCVPSSVAVIGHSCFTGCFSLLSFTFALPTHLQALLSLPPLCAGPVVVPDSVEMFGFKWDPKRPVSYTFEFGRESRLTSLNEPSMLN